MRRRSFLALARPGNSVSLAIGNYGMQAFTVDQALASIREIGYDGAELCLMKGWPSEPAQLDQAARRRIRQQPLPIVSMLENFSLLVSEADHQLVLDRIRIAATLGHDVAPHRMPELQSVLGGKPAEWEQVKDKMAGRLADWARVASENRLKIAIKAHIGSAADTPEKLIWLLDQVKSKAIRGIYDYSHFQWMGLDLEQTLQQLIPHSSFVTVKDANLNGGKGQFLLPGEGTVDYPKYFACLRAMRYRGWMLVEVSRQLQTLPGYDAIEAAKRSYRHMAARLRSSGLRR